MAFIPRLAFLLLKKEQFLFLVKRLGFLLMPKKTNRLNCLKIKPFGSAMVLISVFFFSLLLAFPYPSSTAYAQTHQIFLPFIANSKTTDITLAWNYNSEPDVAGYKLYLGNSSQNYTQVIDVGMTDQYTIRDLIEGTVYFFAVTAYNQNGLESGFSNEIQYP